MLDDFLKDSEETQAENYPIETDDSFTPDEIEAIKRHKASLLSKLNKNRSVLKGLEVSFWGITSYSLARFMVLSSGTAGIPLAIAACFLINNISNREVLDSVNINYDEGMKASGIGGFMLKFGLSTLVTIVILWGALGDLLALKDNSSKTYDSLRHTVEEFNRLPDPQQDKWLIFAALVGAAAVYTAVDSKGRR